MATAQVLPKELRLSAPPTMPQARSYLFKQQSTQSSYDTSNQVVQINIPRLQRSYLTKDSYLSFRLTAPAVTTATGARFDTVGAFGLIDKIEIYDYLGSTLLESTSGHGQLMGVLMDLETSLAEVSTHYNTICGTDGYKIATADATDAPTASALANEVKSKINLKSSTHGLVLKTGNLVVTDRYEFAIPLFSFLGLLSSKFVPLHNGFTIMLTLNPTRLYTGSEAATDWNFTVSNVYMNCQILELGPTAESMLLSSSQGQPLVIPAKAYRNYKSSVKTGDSTFRLDLNLNVASLTNVLWIMRRTANLTTDAWKRRCLSYRNRNNLQSWYFQYGSSILPQTSGIKCNSGDVALQNRGVDEAYIELLKSRHSLNSDSFNTQITHQLYGFDGCTDVQAALSTTNVNGIGKFAAGIDLELVPGRSQNLICGMNTNGMNTSIYGTFLNNGTTVLGAEQDVTVDAWCEYDAFINISPGIATTVSF